MRKLFILCLVFFVIIEPINATDIYSVGVYSHDNYLDIWDWKGDYMVGVTVYGSFDVEFLFGQGTLWARTTSVTGRTCDQNLYGDKKYGSNSFPISHHFSESISCNSIDRGIYDYSRSCIGCSRSMFTPYPINQYSSAHFYNITDIYSISGTTGCIDNVTLAIKDGDDYYTIGYKDLSFDNDVYSFDIINGTTYMISFSDGGYLEFLCDDDKILDYNMCNYIYGYTCHIDWVRLYKNVVGVWEYEGLESQPSFDFDDYEFLISNEESYKINFSDGHEYRFSCSGNDIIYDHDICVWVHPPSPYQPKEMIPWYVGFDNNVVLMKDNHGNFIENSQTAIYNKDTHSYIQKWKDTPEPYILLANNTDSNDEVIVMCKTFDGIFIIETYDPIFGTDENITWCNWTIPIMYNLNLIPTDENKNPLHDVLISMYEYTPLNPLSFHGYDNYWGHIPIHNCSGFSRCDLKSEKIGYNDYVSTGLNWTSKNAMIKDYKHNINMVKTL